MTKVVVPRGPYRTGIKRRREIVDAASRIFARYGYAGGSLRQIAGDVGVTPAALARHFDNKYGLLQAVLTHWEEENDHWFDGARGVEYFRRLPKLVEFHTSEPGLIELLLTVATEATDPQHPARAWAVKRYDRTIQLGIAYLHEARDIGEIHPMDDNQIELEARGVFALMDGMQLQWLLNPSLPVAQMFKDQLEPVLNRWTRGAKPVKKARPPAAKAQPVPHSEKSEKVVTDEGTSEPVAHA
ncbi:MAG TPA: TetR/AcrR family transcriptional regulator [Streptosporangiaceae bacterium]|jgi:AcrR family transcriptional regulator|nr:TetR/AcrR family transcriptional regulator [Streptosporangiaceae bacterium]